MKYSRLELDIIQEIANIGGGNAASSISKLIDKPVTMTVPIAEILNYEEVFDSIMAEDIMVNAILVNMTGEIEGKFLFVSTDEVKESLVKMMVPDGIEDIKHEISVSAMDELVNILVKSFVNAISKMVEKTLITSVPLHLKDMFGAIFSSVYIDTEQYDTNVMIIKDEFIYQGDKLESSLYFVPKPGVLQKMFKYLGIGEV
ncbi:MAG: chemotaxis protein CheC [Tissierellia bacterium]|nr:chemotaxis protein CheC [Tissierellia bacterium]MDD4726864.1 chemotaxis protein CheC [Tissierellia bacterium]